MDIGTIVLNPFNAAHLAYLHVALVETCGRYRIDPAAVRVAYAAHHELGPSLFIHLQLGKQAGFDFFTQALPYDPNHPGETEAGIGATLSGCLNAATEESLGADVPVARAWTVLFERRSSGWVIHEGFFNTMEATDKGNDGDSLERLRTRLKVDDGALLRQKLETPDTPSMPITELPPTDLAAAIRLRLS